MGERVDDEPHREHVDDEPYREDSASVDADALRESAFEVRSTRSIPREDRLGRAADWVFVDARRDHIVVAVGVLVFALALAVAFAGLLPLSRGALVGHVLSRFVSGTIPFVTIVAALNQIVLSTDLGPIGKLRRQMDEMRDFREDVEDVTDAAVSPAEPAAFIRHVVGGIATAADRIEREDVEEGTASAVATNVADVLGAEARVLREHLDRGDIETFHEGALLLDYDPGRHLLALRRLRAYHGDELDVDARDAIDDLEGLVERADVARQYFKTLHIEHELASMSRAVLFAGLPAIVLGGLVALAYAELATLLSATALSVLVAGTFTVVVLPYLVLFAYMLRVVTIARKTTDFGPFVTTSD